ncbi:hypothetical protein GCM10010260_55930 [Streptomyces filipinensis]|uniref:Uncharacterized protein n=1 Tax=Streptomyces filipinensis TaxID=66887 RepID=A0A918IFC2_9ACTN|nr:hypothetical protein [Streptomyces filipinensis]GGV10137.1 hypothetical protein GCM10010260_55930 [Streptomyces filipinensis]
MPAALPSPLSAPQVSAWDVGPAPGKSRTPTPAASSPKACTTAGTGPAAKRRLPTPAAKSELP